MMPDRHPKRSNCAIFKGNALLRSIFSAALILLLVTACSRLELAYRNADRLLEYYAWQIMGASNSQRSHWRPLLEATLQRHREEELPLIIGYLDQLQQLVDQTDRPTGGACLVDTFRHLYRRHARLAVELCAPLLARLDGEQVNQLAAYAARRQQDAVERYLDPDLERRTASRQQRFIEHIERWTGELNASQRQQVRDALEDIPDLSESWLAYRAQQTARLLAMLEIGAGTPTLQTYLDDWWVRLNGQSTEYRRSRQTATKGFVRLLDELTQTLSDDQREALLKRLADLREDLAQFVPQRQPSASTPVLPPCTVESI